MGSIARYGVGEWAQRSLGSAFPYGTLLVNAQSHSASCSA